MANDPEIAAAFHNRPSRFSAWRLFVWLEMPNTISSPLFEIAGVLVRFKHIASLQRKRESRPRSGVARDPDKFKAF